MANIVKVKCVSDRSDYLCQIIARMTVKEFPNVVLNILSLKDENVEFEVKWSFPDELFRKASEELSCTIECWWSDDDIGNNTGHMIFDNGNIIEQTYYEPFSSESYETYAYCWEDMDCLEIVDCEYHRKTCSMCGKCN